MMTSTTNGRPWRVGICVYCGQEGLVTLDHVIPRVKGGQRTPDNVADACPLCNNKKGDQDVDVFVTWLSSEEGQHWLRARPPFRNVPPPTFKEKVAAQLAGYCPACGGRLPKPGHFTACSTQGDVFLVATSNG